MEFEKAYSHLNEAQREAVDHIEGPLLVIAGPGTGKTQLLSVRVANILKQTDASPENILCLTFTDAGASNMRKRLSDFIGPEAYKVQIQTYHSFGSYILQEHRPDLSSAIDELEQFTIIRDIQSHLDSTDILRGDWNTKDIISTISQIKQAALSPDDLRLVAAKNQLDNEALIKQLRDDLSGTASTKYPANRSYYENILATLQNYVEHGQPTILGKIESIANSYFRSLADIFAKEDEVKSIATPLRSWREKYFEKDANNDYIFKDTVAIKKLLSLANIMEQYVNYLDASGKFDYSDMILKAINLLETDDEKRFNVQERFQYILLDEFQDTNDAQAKLVSLITDNPANDQPNIMAVGDDDQAIYGFQGANTSNFFDFDQHYHPHHVFLTKNYRSGKAILDFAHNIIELCEDRFCKAPNVNIDKRISAENPPAKTEISLREYQSAQEEYSATASEIRKLLDQGIRGNKIAIIVPKHKYLISILPYLRKLEIPVAYTKSENILDNPDVQEVLNFCDLLLRLAESPKSADPDWMQLLTQPCWDLKTSDVINLIQGAYHKRCAVIDEMLNSEGQLKDIAEFCYALAAKVHSYSAEYIINAVCAKLYPNPSLDNYELYSNLNSLRELARNKNHDKKLMLVDFISLLHAYENAEIDIVNSSPYHESDNAIQLMTAHSSKGLEFDHVFLIATDNKNWSDSKGNNNKLVLPRNLEYVRHTGGTNDERVRLLFVAITRAKAMLHMSYSTSDFSGTKAERLKYLDIRESGDAPKSLTIPEPFNQVIESQITDIATEDIAPSTWIDNYLPKDNERKNLLMPLVEHYRISPTHFNSFIDLEYGGPENFVKNFIIRAPGEYSISAAYGTFVHEIMDELCKEQLDDETLIQHFHAMVDDCDASDEERADLHKRGDSELRGFLTERGEALRKTPAKSEYNFANENIMLGDALLTGKIDRIEINEANKTIVVSDFKTSRPKSKWANNDNTFKYRIQLYFYKILVESSRAFQNYRVTGGRIDYISADTYGQIRPLELEFKDSEEAHIKEAIQYVFHLIKTLEMPSVSEFKDSNKFLDYLCEEAKKYLKSA